MTPDIIDHREVGRGRVATQYTASPKFLAFIDALMVQANEIEALLHDLEKITDIDESEGVQLDVIGDIVGISRRLKDAILLAFFGFDDAENSLNFGEEGNIAVGGRFVEEDEPYLATNLLNDADYRLLIRAKIAKNHSDGTSESIISVLKYLFNAEKVIVDDIGGMAFKVGIGRALSYSERVLIKSGLIIPKPAAVQIAEFFYFKTSIPFGFSDQSNVGTFDQDGCTFVEEF